MPAWVRTSRLAKNGQEIGAPELHQAAEKELPRLLGEIDAILGGPGFFWEPGLAVEFPGSCTQQLRG